ncbi:MAG TPA: hypothetical protein DDW52_12355 [Planctomycetaceae bacterium]|nr:hypothetical protein [Planctomycetaceae bacterium]
MENHWINAVAEWMEATEAPPIGEKITSAIQSASPAELQELVEVVETVATQSPDVAARARTPLQLAAAHYQSLVRQGGVAPELLKLEPAVLRSCYFAFVDEHPIVAAHALQMLAAQPDDESLEALADALNTSAPSSWQSTAVGLSPLWNANEDHLLDFFHSLGDSLMQASVLSVVLDLAAHAVRSGKLERHPWSERGDQFAKLLESVTNQLAAFQKDPSKFGDDIDDIQSTLGDGVALTVSLCDALGLIGHPDSVPALEAAMKLTHRRIQTEAAGALTRQGNTAGREHLIALADDRVARQRAVAYAEELECVDLIDEQHRTPVALAESRLAGWLAEPAQFGMAPSGMQLHDQATLYWPSYEDPQECYLFKFWFNFPAAKVENIGIAGPVNHAFHSDMRSLPTDDIYAAFAGWHAEHEDIYQVPVNLLNPRQRIEAEALVGRVEATGLETVEIQALAFFLGDFALVAHAERDGQPLTIVADEQSCLTMPRSSASSSSATNGLSPDIVLAIYRGRKLLRSFNG